MQNIHFSSKSNDWATPQDFFDKINDKYHFTLDACAIADNAKCANYFTPEQDGLKQDWGNNIVWCNPPYGREIGKWVKKGYDAAMNGALVVMLIPARTDTKYFHDYVIKGSIEFIKGRLKFGNSKNSAPFPSLLVEFIYENFEEFNLTRAETMDEYETQESLRHWGLI